MPRILTPLIAAARGLDNMEATPGLSDYVRARFGSAEECRKLMLADFFRHAFDGSGADNYYDAGSCIDGRLTSAWNWCSKLEKKPYVRRPQPPQRPRPQQPSPAPQRPAQPSAPAQRPAPSAFVLRAPRSC